MISFFQQKLDNQAQREMSLVSEDQTISPEEIMALVLKPQTNPFNNLDIELREETDKRFASI